MLQKLKRIFIFSSVSIVLMLIYFYVDWTIRIDRYHDQRRASYANACADGAKGYAINGIYRNCLK